MLRSVLSILLLFTITTQLSFAEDPSAKPGVIFVAGGAGNLVNLPSITKWAGKQCKLPHEVRAFEWQHGKGRIVLDIQDARHLIDKANELAQQILEYQVTHPDRPIYLIGKSTGAIIVLMAAEKVPISSLERIILLSPAVSPNYDLVPAIHSTRAGVISFHSSLDIAVLNWATTLVGTADRHYNPSAGLNGFVLPAAKTSAALDYERLIQINWSPSHAWYGHLGGHMGNGMPLFLLYEVMPYLRNAKK